MPLGMLLTCLDEIEYEVLLKSVSFKEARKLIEDNSEKVCYVKPGYKIFQKCYLIGVPPIPMGIRGSDLIIPIVRPRLGTSVVRVSAEQEIKRLIERA
jgi:hypothetical protein